MKNLKISIFELIFYIISGLLFLTGLVFAIVGIVGDHLSPNNPILNAEKLFMPFRYFGIILISSSAIFATFTFLFFGRNEEKKAEREERRKQRLEFAEKIDKQEQAIANTEETSTDGEIKDIESKPVSEKEETVSTEPEETKNTEDTKE